MAIDAVVEEVATNLEEVAEVTRKINTSGVGYLLGGLVIGGAVGFYFGYKLNREKIRAEAFKQAEEELSEIREVYQQKLLANADKPALETVVEELGYSVKVEDQNQELPERPLRPPVPVRDPIVVKKDDTDGWDFGEELRSRTPDAPYVIHQNEWSSEDSEYTKVVYTYYAGDDVLVDSEDNHPIPHPQVVVGQDNLKWGHGSDDIDVVFIRNDRLEMDIQICRTRKSFEEEVLGLENDDTN